MISKLEGIACSPRTGFSPNNTTIPQLCKISLPPNSLALIISLMRMGVGGDAKDGYTKRAIRQTPENSASHISRVSGMDILYKLCA